MSGQAFFKISLGVLILACLLLAGLWNSSLTINRLNLDALSNAPGPGDGAGVSPAPGPSLLRRSRLAQGMNPANAQVHLATADLQRRLNPDAPGGPWDQDYFRALAVSPSWEVPLLALSRPCSQAVDSSRFHQINQCLTFYKQALKRNPSYGYLHLRHASILSQLSRRFGNDDQALAKDICAEYGEALRLLSFSFVVQPWYAEQERKAYRDCLELSQRYQTARNINPLITRQWQAMGLFLGQKPPSVIERDSQAIFKDLESYKNVQQSYRSFALGLEEAGRIWLSEMFLRHFTTLQPSNDAGWRALVELLLRHKGTFGSSYIKATLGEAYGSARYDPRLWTWFGETACGLSAIKLANLFFSQAVASDPRQGFVHTAQGDCRARHGLYAAALDDYRQAVKIDPDSADGWVKLARAQAKLGRYTQAVESLRKALALSPGHGGAKRALRAMGIQ